jgi:hypothetical protein
MIKIIGISASIAFAIGSIAGYTLQKLEANQGNSNDAIAATVKSKVVDLRPPKSKRSELLLKYDLCTGTKTSPATLERFNDKELNDLVFSICTQNS